MSPAINDSVCRVFGATFHEMDGKYEMLGWQTAASCDHRNAELVSTLGRQLHCFVF
jgi:hypothetical protein